MTRLLILTSIFWLGILPLQANPLTQGYALFTGQATLAAETVTGQKTFFACHQCHGRDGMGGIEGDVPAIDARLLKRATTQRPGYNRDSFVRALRHGVDAAGRDLSRLMPRYDFTEQEADALFSYLEIISSEQRSGVGPRNLHVGIPALNVSPALNEPLRDAVQNGLSQALGGRSVYGRVVTVETIPFDDTKAAAEMLVVTSPIRAQVSLYTRAGIPVLHPIGTLQGDEDPSILRSATSDQRTIRSALAKELAAMAVERVVIESGTADEAENFAATLRMQNPASPPDILIGAAEQTVRSDDLVLLSSGRMPTGGWDGRLWVPWSRLRDQSVQADARGPVITVVDTPWLVSRALSTQSHPIVLHGERAGAVLGEALKMAGRNVTRASLLAALEDAELKDWGLDYNKHQLTGTTQVEFVQIPAPQALQEPN